MFRNENDHLAIVWSTPIYTASFPSHRFPLTFPHRDTSYDIIIIPNQILYYYFFIPKRTRRRHCDTHARTHYIITPGCPLYMGQWDDFPRTPYTAERIMPVDDDPFPLRSTLFRTLAPATPFVIIFFPWHLAIVWPTRAS